MIDIKLLRENPEKIIDALQKGAFMVVPKIAKKSQRCHISN